MIPWPRICIYDDSGIALFRRKGQKSITVYLKDGQGGFSRRYLRLELNMVGHFCTYYGLRMPVDLFDAHELRKVTKDYCEELCHD